MLNTFYFTYGQGGKHPYEGGWTEVVAETASEAISGFRKFHPDKTSGVLNCASFYSEDQYNPSIPNFGKCCVERIVVCQEETNFHLFTDKLESIEVKKIYVRTVVS